ncbi:PPC domain-containing protein [Aporhodopirellula aestuarii]|uniref:PPC domain-containing protein n=1 Tax=Aporhodopirellula aestuarii TaxID=2950107 RepID=A0ABT0TZD8_9BACT|nr:PPC domain-containing protein [Aporhodopirellula aestuarii]MCM2369978.1 PPC domain-containing protein [Aporhodopirellula aestuarii]
MPVRISVIVLSLFCLSNVCVGAMIKAIESVSPRIAQRGTTVEVTISGVSLDDPKEIIFYQPGIRATGLKVSETPPKRRHTMHGGRIAESVVCQFEIAADCPPGEHAFRLRTADELTCIATFHVTPFPVTDENEQGHNSNDQFETAIEVTPNVTVRGELNNGARGDVDLYKVPVKAGQRLAVEVGCARIADVHYGDSEFDTAVRVLDENGRELAANDDNSLLIQDPIVSVKIPRDGHVYVAVGRSIFVPSNRPYCVHISDTLRPLAAYPPGGQAGSKERIRMLGDALGATDRMIPIPDSDGTFNYFGDAPTPLPLRSSPYPNVLEDPRASITAVDEFPIAINGIIDSGEEFDSYRVHVRKGDRWHVRVYAATLGSPIDPLIRIRPIDADGKLGKPEVDLDDVTLEQRDVYGTNYRSRSGLPDTLDPSVVWEPKQDGDYVIELHDTSGSGGPTGVYRIEIESPRTLFQTVLKSTTFDWTESMRVTGLAVPQGNRWTVNVNLPQGQCDTIKGDFDVVARGLPKGMKLIVPPIPKGKIPGVWPMQFVADADAAPAGAVITLEAIPADPNQQVESRSVQQVPFINHSGGDAWNTVRVDSYITAVVDPAPFSIELVKPAVPLVRGGELAVPIKLHRQPGFEGAIEFGAVWSPPGLAIQPPQTLQPGETEGFLRVSATNAAPLTTWPLVAIASTVRDDIDPFLGVGHTRVSSEFIELTVADPYVELAAKPESVRRGEKKSFVWNVKHKNAFDGEAHVRLLGLPKGVTVMEPMPTLNSQSKEIRFEIEATDEALLGSATGLSCEVILEAEGQEIVQRSGNGVLRIDPGQG